MPGVSTHINFFKLLNDRGFNNYNSNYFILGSIAPDYYVNFYDERLGCVSHFKESIFSKSNLNDFVKYISNKEFDYNVLSYIKGYYTHLWLDNYLHDFGDYLEIGIPEGMEEKSTGRYVKENIRMYDLKNIREELVKLSHYNFSSDGFINNLPVSIDKAIELSNIFINLNLSRVDDLNMPTLVKESNYYKFLEGAINTFLIENIY